MDSRTAWSADIREALAAVSASTAALESLVESGPDGAGSPCTDPLPDTDPLQRLADDCLEGLAEIARQEARTAALKVRMTAEYVRATRALASPAASPRERTTQQMALVAEVACVLTISERSAGALLHECRTLTTALPLTLTALQAGTISWQHARIIVDETTSLNPDGAAALEAHFLDTDAPNPARGCPAGDLVPPRFRAKARLLAGTPPPGQHRKTLRQQRRRTAGRVPPGPGPHGMAFGLPPGPDCSGHLGTDHRRRPLHASPGRGQDPHPAPRRRRR